MKNLPVMLGGSSSASSDDLFSPSMDVGTPLTEYPLGSPPVAFPGEDIEIAILRSQASMKRSSQLNDRFADTLDQLSAVPVTESSILDKVQTLSAFVREIIDTSDELHDDNTQDILRKCLKYFNKHIFQDEDIHPVVASLDLDRDEKAQVIQTYYHAVGLTEYAPTRWGSGLLSDALFKRANIIAVFNGQGVENYFDELQHVFDTYSGLVTDLILTLSEQLESLSCDIRAKDMYSHGLDVLSWLEHPETRPEQEYLLSAPVSQPLIGLVQLLNYYVACKVLNKSPGEIGRQLSGAAGHSQGIVVAALLGTVVSWASYYEAAHTALEVLFWTGCRSQQFFPLASIPPNLVDQSEKLSPMLSVKGASLKHLQKHLNDHNKYLADAQKATLALINGRQQFVVAGEPLSLYAFANKVRSTANATENTSRIPFSQRQPVVTARFLSISVPFHSHLLAGAETQIREDLSSIYVPGGSLLFPVLRTDNGADLRDYDDLIPELVHMLVSGMVDWEKATRFPSATHILDFGPGGETGIGAFLSQMRSGTAVRTILATVLNGPSKTLGYMPELYSRKRPVVYNTSWQQGFSPRLLRVGDEMILDTKFSRVLGLPPVMVAGMTPTTVSWEFVAEVMNAGYHVEFAAGGYHNADSMREALLKLVEAIPAGRGITCNVIYANPRALGWQIPLLSQLRKEGVPVTGLTIGAGVPSIDVATEYIRDLGLSHISFKPGSKDAIDGVLRIAEANPDFPIILQWTGGRGGGHHSYEDFHEPMLERYSQIRAHPNIILVAGSGFGGAEDTYPYMVGSWSTALGYAPMPFDAILLGSRVMIAKEAHTSPAVKQAIADTVGVPDSEWEGTYKKPTGGIMTVKSEMGEPIHKLATRAVKLWAELDKEVFSLPPAQRLEELKRRKPSLIQRLNNDFQKVWFGRDATGQTVDVCEMTYAEVVKRAVDLCYLPNGCGWIDPSYKAFVGDVVRCLENRLRPRSQRSRALLQNLSQLDEPFAFTAELLQAYPQAEKDVLNRDDENQLNVIYRQPGRKPLPFIMAFDDSFEYWFKKDSLWQSERLEAVIDSDVGRVCVLQGPVAVQYTTTVDEPVKQILDNIHRPHVQSVLKHQYGSDYSKVPSTEYLYHLPMDIVRNETASIKKNRSFDPPTVAFRLGDAQSSLPTADQWLGDIGGSEASWRRALLTSHEIVQGKSLVKNPVRALFSPRAGLSVRVLHPDLPQKTVILMQQDTHVKDRDDTTLEIRAMSTTDILLTLRAPASGAVSGANLVFHFQYKPACGKNPIHEVMETRNRRISEFYQELWVRDDTSNIDPREIKEDTVLVTREAILDFTKAIDNRNVAYRGGKPRLYAPLDMAIVIAWKPLMRSLFTKAVDGDILKLLHLKNEFEMLNDANPIQEGDLLSSSAEIESIQIKKDSGKVVKVRATITREGEAIIAVTSEFILQGRYQDYANTFEKKGVRTWKMDLKSRKETALLRSKSWFHIAPGHNLDNYHGQELIFRMRSSNRFRDSTAYSQIETSGEVSTVIGASEVVIGSVVFSSTSHTKDPVIDFLSRRGFEAQDGVYFDTPTPLATGVKLNMPVSSTQYAAASADTNPIHVSHAFAQYAGHEGRVIHGMQTSGLIRGLVELYAAENNPQRMRSWSASFKGKVSPGDLLLVDMNHTGMNNGRLMLSVTARNAETGVEVFSATSEMEQKASAYVFTGQGSQKPGMGMDLYETSEAAREVWTTAERYFMDTYGFSILEIVRRNPTELTVYFGGSRGKAIRENYMSLTFDIVDETGKAESVKAFREITSTTRSFTYRSTGGLLHETIFTQPALVVMELARFHDIRARGLIENNSCFAGHSLGEYAALAAMGEVFTVEGVAAITFYRGLTMQKSVELDHKVGIQYSMCAVNPSRVSKNFSEQDLRRLVSAIQTETSGLCEIVNFNVENMQYVCAGDLRSLDCLSEVVDHLVAHPNMSTSIDSEDSPLLALIQDCLARTDAKPKPLVLQRCKATIPLKVNVPFHSSLLRPGVETFRQSLEKAIPEHMVRPEKLIGKYIPNLTAQPFELSKAYFENVLSLSNSPRVRKILDSWDEPIQV